MNVAIIPARGGSKRIPRKNIKRFDGKPMIAWAIELAKSTKVFEHIVVSTDDKEIARISAAYGAQVPFLRPSFLSCDQTTTLPVISHAFQEIVKQYTKIEAACCIYPASPLLEVQDILQSFELLRSCNASFVYPVLEFSHPIQRAMRRTKSGIMQFISPKNELVRTQDLEKTYHDAGQFYWGTADAWLFSDRIHSNGAGYPIPSWRVVDIDNEDDWRRAEILKKIIFSDKSQME